MASRISGDVNTIANIWYPKKRHTSFSRVSLWFLLTVFPEEHSRWFLQSGALSVCEISSTFIHSADVYEAPLTCQMLRIQCQEVFRKFSLRARGERPDSF